MIVRTYPGLFSLITIVSGIVIAEVIRVPSWLYLLIASAALLVAITTLIVRQLLPTTISLAVVLIGFSAFHFAQHTYDFDDHHVSRYTDTQTRYRIFGRIDDWPEQHPDRVDLTVRIDSIGAQYLAPASGRILLKVADTTAFVQYGDRVEFYARLSPLTGGGSTFNYNRYLHLQGIHALAYTATHHDISRQPRNPVGLVPVVDTIRSTIFTALARTLKPRSAALAGGFLIGETRDIPRDIYRNFRDTGTLHLLAVSGSNVALVIGFVMVLLRPFGTRRLWRTILLLVALILFSLLCKGEPSVIRASVMAALVLVARLVGRRINLNNIIALTAAAILLVSPTQLFSVGFQLSFVTAWGLVFVTPHAYRLLDRKNSSPIRRWLLLALIASLTAQLFSSPLIALYFHRIPLLTTVANLIIVPLVSIAVVGTLILLVLEFIVPPLAALAGALLDHIMNLILYALDCFSGPHAPLIDTGDLSWVIVMILYAWLLLVGYSTVSARPRRWAVIATLVLLNLGLFRLAWTSLRPDHHYDIHLSRVPGGIAAVVIPNRGEAADLIITNIASRNYPVDERILLPWLDRLGVADLHCLIVLGADFDAASQLVALSSALKADTLFVHQRLAGTIADIVNHAPAPLPFPCLPFGDSLPATGDGYYLSDQGVLLHVSSAELLWVRSEDDLALQPRKPSSNRPARWLICGDQISSDSLPNFFSWSDGIVCAELEQPESSEHIGYPLPSFPDQNTRLIDLRLSGSLTLRLSTAGSNAVQIVGSR